MKNTFKLHYKMKYKIILLTILIRLACKVVFSQPTQEWVQRYNGPANSFDIVSKMLIDKIVIFMSKAAVTELVPYWILQ